MRNRTWPLLALAFGALILVIGLSGAALYRHLGDMVDEVTAMQRASRESEHVLNALRSEVYSLGILVRDYLLDTSQEATREQHEDLVALRTSAARHLNELSMLIGPEGAPALAKLRAGVDEYWQLIDSVLAWTPAQKGAFGSTFLRRRMPPYRSSVLAIAAQIEVMNNAAFTRREAAVARTLGDIRGYLSTVIAVTIALGLLIAAASIVRMTVLERRTELHRERIEEDRREMRSLSQALVKAQEAERKSISRELHDQVGQLLTALRMEIGNIEQLRRTSGGEFDDHVTSARALTEQTLHTVRDLAMGLRPSMLDDLGLASALKWQGRQFTRRTGIPVEIEIEGNLDGLPEDHRTCVYRVVQEALTNCARHAKAQEIRVVLHGHHDTLSLTVQDNGVGFAPDPGGDPGLGLIGIEERVRELGGKLTVVSQPQRGTLLHAEIPCTREVAG